MPERTKRGDEDRKREDEQTSGQLADDTREREPATQTMQETRDRGVAPAKDAQRDGRGAEEE